MLEIETRHHPAAGPHRWPTGDAGYFTLFASPELRYRLERHITARAWEGIGSSIPDPTAPVRHLLVRALLTAGTARARFAVWVDR